MVLINFHNCSRPSYSADKVSQRYQNFLNKIIKKKKKLNGLWRKDDANKATGALLIKFH